MFSVKHPQKYVRKNIKHLKAKKLRKRKSPLFKAIIESWKDFCTTSSFVGFRYIYVKNRTIIDVLFWVLLMVVLMYWSIIFVNDFMDRYHSLSTTTIIETQHFPTSLTVFPASKVRKLVRLQNKKIDNFAFYTAVTACLSGRVRKSKVYNFIDNITSNVDLQQTVNINKFVEIFNFETDVDSITISDAGKVFAEYNLTMQDMLNMTSHTCEEVFTVCRWAGKMIPCAMVFRQTMAVGGFCCSFNYPITPENIRRKKWLKTNTFGMTGGLSFAFKTIEDEDYYNKMDYGNTLRVIVHPPHTVPTFNENDILIAKSMETTIEITNLNSTANGKVISLPMADRDCAFGFEKELKDFVRYTNKNCLVQCRMDRVRNNCGCLSYMFPSNGSDICPTEKFHCSFENRRVGETVYQGGRKTYTESSDCDCPDDCHVIKQLTKAHSWKLWINSNYSVDEFYAKITSDHGVVHISFAKSTIMQLTRQLSFDEIELASNIGGIIALFLGCSFISVIEVTYFLIIRMLTFYNTKI